MDLDESQQEEEPGLRTIVEDMDFANLSNFLEGLTLRKPKTRVDNLKRYFDHFRVVFKENYGTLDASKANNDSIFSLARIFLPTEDRKRSAYNLKGHTLARLFARTLGLDKDSVDGRKLLEYKNPHKNLAAGDLGSVVFSVLESRVSGRSSNNKSPSIAELHSILDQLARSPDSDVNLEGQRKILQTFIPRLSPVEGKWLVRILLKSLGLGFTTKQIFQCIHPRAQEVYNRIGNLEAVCIKLNDPDVDITADESSVQLFQPFRPMLCARLNSLDNPPEKSKSSRAEIVTLPNPPFIIETKWDGERFQIHYDASQPSESCLKYFSRKSFDYTTNFNLTLSPRLVPQIKSGVKSFILDGEMMAYQKRTGIFTDKGANIDVKRMNLENPNHCPAFVAYDLVYFNGEDLINWPLKRRLEILVKEQEVFEPKKGVIHVSTHQIAETKDQVMEALNEAVEEMREGLVVKELGSTYELAKRSNSWLKIKPEFFSEYSLEDLDLIILGAYFSESGGASRKAGAINHFLVGLVDDSQPGKEKFYPLARVGTGRLRNAQIAELINDLGPQFLEQENPGFNVLFKGSKRPNYYLNPKTSFVVQVKATEILRHDSHALGYTLRFPRVVSVRRDKTWDGCLTHKEFHDILRTHGGKFAKRNDEISPTKKKPVQQLNKESTPPPPGRSLRSKRDPLIIPKEAPAKPPQSAASKTSISSTAKYFTMPLSSSAPKKESMKPGGSKSKKNSVQHNTFDSRVFCVIGSADWKAKTEAQIKLHGGEIVQNPTQDLFAIIAETVSAKVNTLLKKDLYDILKESWLSKCIESQSVVRILPSDLYGSSPATKLELEKDYDQYGDSYTKKLSSKETKNLLSKIMQEMDVAEEDNSDSGLDDSAGDARSTSPLKRILEELDPLDSSKLRKYNVFEDCKIAFRGELHSQDALVHMETIKFYGGQVTLDEGEPGVTHVIAWDKDSPTKRKQLSAHVVSPKWLSNCLQKKKLMEELNYMC